MESPGGCRPKRHGPAPRRARRHPRASRAYLKDYHMDMKFRGLVFTGSGLLDVMNPAPEAIHLDDIAHGLAAKSRFGGHTRRDLPFYSVAWHSLFCETIAAQMDLPPVVRLQALLHDAPEYVLGDAVTPVKSLLSDFGPIESRLWAAVAGKVGVPVEFAPEVKEIDALALDAERHHIGIPGDWTPGPADLGPWASEAASWFKFWQRHAHVPRFDAALFSANAKALIGAVAAEAGVAR